MGFRDELANHLQGAELTRGLKRALATEFATLGGGDSKPVKPKKRKDGRLASRRHVVIPDTQIGPDVPTVHLEWIGAFIVDEYAGDDIAIVHLGDHWDMPSLSSYDRGTARMEGRRIPLDILAGNDGMRLLRAAFDAHNLGKRKKWEPEWTFLFGNHEERILRAVQENAQLDGLLSFDLLNLEGWQTHPFLELVWLDGIAYSHYFANPMSGRPYGGMNIETRLKTIGHSFVMGHQQVFLYGCRAVAGRLQHGLVAGACYLHDEEYRGPQGNAEKRGIVVLNDVHDGDYDVMPVSLDYLCRRYEGMRLAEFREKHL